jgi:hypothetical protein
MRAKVTTIQLVVEKRAELTIVYLYIVCITRKS